MARTKKKAKKKAPRRAKPKPKAKPARKSKSKRAGSAKTEVQRRWNEYWKCRKDLEEAVETVRAAQSKLSEAIELERSRRGAFEETKNALKQLLEVESPSADTPPFDSPNVLDLAGD